MCARVLGRARTMEKKKCYLAIARYLREYLTTRSVTPWWKFPSPPWYPLASCCGAVRGQQEDTHVHKTRAHTRTLAHTRKHLSTPTAKNESASTICRDTVQPWVWTAEPQIYPFASLASFIFFTKTQVRMFVARLGVAYDLITRLSHTTHALFLSTSAHKCSTLQVGLPLCFFSVRSQTSDSGWLSPRKLCWSSRRSANSGNVTMTRSCCWPSPKLKMCRWERRGTNLVEGFRRLLEQIPTSLKKKSYEGKI